MVRIGTDWFVNVQRPKCKKDVKSEEEHIKACSGCPYGIWEKPEMVAGFMASMCGVQVGSIGMAAAMDAIGEKRAGSVRFTTKGGQPEEKLAMLHLIKAHAEKGGWKFRSMAKQETLKELDLLIIKY